MYGYCFAQISSVSEVPLPPCNSAGAELLCVLDLIDFPQQTPAHDDGATNDCWDCLIYHLWECAKWR
jgi:hypothetical protein